MGLGGDTLMNKGVAVTKLEKTLRDVEKAKIYLDYEAGTLVSPAGIVLKIYSGEAHMVSVPKSEFPVFKGNVFTHNHISGRTFTTQDIVLFVDSELYEARVSTPAGIFFSIKKGTGEINRSMGNVMIEENIGSHIRAARLIREGIENGIYPADTLSNNAELLFDVMGDAVDKWLTKNAAEFGYIYTKGEI